MIKTNLIRRLVAAFLQQRGISLASLVRAHARHFKTTDVWGGAASEAEFADLRGRFSAGVAPVPGSIARVLQGTSWPDGFRIVELRVRFKRGEAEGADAKLLITFIIMLTIIMIVRLFLMIHVTQ